MKVPLKIINVKFDFFSGTRRIQGILLKVALVLGASVSGGVGFCDLIEPETNNSARGWRVKVDPPNHPYNKINIDALIGAEGKRVTVPGSIERNEIFYIL